MNFPRSVNTMGPSHHSTHGDGVMKIIVSLIMLSSIIGPHAIAGDTKEALHNALTICNQFVIQDPDPRIFLDDLRGCCIFGNHVRDCHINIWDGIDR